MSQKFDGAENASPNQSDNLYQKQQLILKPKSWLTGLLWRPNVKRMTREKNVDGLLQALTHP
ncbi:MAG: hypothetical protein GY797_08660, partial [Deltaproteobacteria bacterium]|nr:hypothetical protein [Deltaproteobacteria bacterium]